MASVSSTFVASGTPSASLFVKGGETFRLAITNTWVGTIRVEESNNGGIAWTVIDVQTANYAADYEAKPYDRVIRLNCYLYTSGTVTYAFQNVSSVLGRSKFSNVPIGQVAYGSVGTSTTPSAVLFYLTDIVVDVPFTATGVGFLNAATVGTDTILVALYDASGRLLANSALAGEVTAGTDAFQQIAFLVPAILKPGHYFIGIQCSGTTTRFRTVKTLTDVNVLAGTVASVFGTVPSTIALPTTFTADKGLVSYIY